MDLPSQHVIVYVIVYAERRAAAAVVPGSVPFSVASALRYLASLLSKCEDAATKAAAAFVSASAGAGECFSSNALVID